MRHQVTFSACGHGGPSESDGGGIDRRSVEGVGGEYRHGNHAVAGQVDRARIVAGLDVDLDGLRLVLECADVDCNGTGEDPPTCLVDPVALDFGTVTVGSQADDTFTITPEPRSIIEGRKAWVHDRMCPKLIR